MRSWQTGTTEVGGFALPPITPVVRLVLIAWVALWVLAFGLGQADPGLVLGLAARADGAQVPTGLFGWLGASPARWFAAPPWFPFWQPLTYGWFHSVDDAGHLIWNLLILYFFGTLLEGILGPRRFGGFFLVALGIAGVFTIVAKAALGVAAPTVGGSGALLAIVVAAAVLRPNTPVLLIFVPVALKWLALGVVALDFIGAMQQVNGYGGVKDHFAHLAGAAFGFVAARRGWLWVDLAAKVEERLEDRRSASRAEDEQKLDLLLDRIRRDGLASLTERERAFLKRMSEAKRDGRRG